MGDVDENENRMNLESPQMSQRSKELKFKKTGEKYMETSKIKLSQAPTVELNRIRKVENFDLK